MEAKHTEIKHPWFVSQKVEDKGEFHTLFNIHDPMSHYRCQIPELLGKRLRGCFHGCWAVLSSNHPRDVIWSLWNPVTSKIINLPPLNILVIRYSGSKGDDISECCLSAPPEDPNSVLLLTSNRKPNFIYCRLGIDSYNRKELRWTESTYANQIKMITGCDGSLHCLTCCNGKVYAYIELFGNLHGTLLIVEVNIVIHDCESKKLGEVVITLLPILEFVAHPIIDCGCIQPLLKGSSTELFLVVLGLKDKPKTVGVVELLKLDMNNKTWEEIQDLKDTILSVELDTGSPIFYSPAIASSEFGGYIHILADKGKIIYSYHVKDKTISFSSIPCVAGTNHVSAWAMLECTRLEGDRVHLESKQDKQGHKEDKIVVRSVKGNHKTESHLRNGLLKMKEFCVGVECLKLSSIPYVGYECRLESDKADDDESHLLNLPPHVLEMLMEFCAGVEYLKFRSTCKRCHLAAPLIPWNNGKASKIMQKYSLPSPWLIVFDKHKGIITLTDPVFDDKYFINTPQELICDDFQIMCSRFGWLLILKPGGSLMFFNPFTSVILELPELPDTYIICFSAPPTSPDCMVVGITLNGSTPCQACIHIVGGEPSWRRTFLNVFGDEFINSIKFYGRDLYALREDGGFDVFREMGREKHAWWRDLAKAPASCCTSLPECFHLRCDRHILRVIVGKFGESVEVFILTVSQKWLKVVKLRKHMIFICGESSVCLDAKTPQMENKIYFPTSPIMYYSLETCRFHTLNNQDSFRDFFGTKHHLSPHGWIEPSWS